jgi:Tol biopolymer transport system component
MSELANAAFINDRPTWSKDGKYLYFEDLLSQNQPIYRIRVSDRKQELITTFETYLRGGIQRGSLEGLSPDGFLITRLDRGGADIYSIDLEVP